MPFISIFFLDPLNQYNIKGRKLLFNILTTVLRTTWTKLIGTSSNERATALEIASDGSIYTGGYTYGDLDGETNNGSMDAFFSKYDSDGNLEWTRLFGNTSDSRLYSIDTASDNSVYVTGKISGDINGQTNNGSEDIFLAKYDSNGTIQWTKLIGTSSQDHGKDIKIGSDGSIYITGHTLGNLNGETLNGGAADAFLVKYNSDGVEQWTKLLGDSWAEYSNAIDIDSDGNIYIVGETFIAKYNSNGVAQFIENIPITNIGYANDVLVNSDGKIYITGRGNGSIDDQESSANDAYIAQYNSNGTRNWTRFIGSTSNETGFGLAEGPNNTVHLTAQALGSIDGHSAAGYGEVLIANYSSDGSKNWSDFFGGSGDEQPYSIETDSSGNILLTGISTGDLSGQTNNGLLDGFLTKLSISSDTGDATFAISGTTQVGQTLSITESTADPDGTGSLTYRWEIYDDSWNWVSNESTYEVLHWAEGLTIRAIISYTDGQGFSEEVTTSSLEIKTDDGDAVFAISGTTEFGQSLSITESTADPDGTGTLSYVWQSSSDEITWTQIGTDSTYTLTSSEEGKKVRAIISYEDGQSFSESVNSSAVEINTIDDGDAVFAISGTIRIGNQLSITESTADPDGVGTLSYVWQSSSDETTWTQIGTDSTYTLTSSEEGKKVRAILSYEDGQGFSESVNTSSIEIKTDDGDAVFEISGATQVGQSLSITESTADPDGTGTLSYVWQSSSDDTTWSQIGTDSTYTLTSSEEGKKVRAILSYTDGQGFSEDVTTSSLEIKTDDGDSVFTISGTISLGELLSITESTTDPDGTGTLSYVWQSSSDEITWTQIGTDSTYTLTSSEEGNKVRAIISYTDGQGFSETIETSTVDLIDDGDAVFAISATGNVVTGDMLRVTESSSDPDGTGTLSYVWQYSSDETTWSQIGTDSTYTLTSSEEGKKVRAIVSYTDGQGFAEEVTSSSIDINQRIYELSTSINVPQEEYTLTTTANTENVTEGTTIYWSLSGTNITLSDFSDGSLTGSGTVGSDGTFSFKHLIASDGETEGYETIDIKIFSDSDRTTQVAATEILIRDAALEEQIAEVVEDVNGVKKIVSQLVQGQNYTLSHIRDYDGNLHAGSNDEETAAAYKYQHTLDINGDGIEEAIYTNMKSGRWVTASINPDTGKIDYSDYGKEGTTRIVGIYDDPLIAVGLENNGFLPDGVTPAPAQFGATGSDRYVDLNGDGDFDDDNEDRLALNSQVRFQNDLKIDNLVAKLSNDFDSDGVREVFWRTSDNSAYLRALMHADGNIRYANYQNEQQMTEYLTDNGFDESTISEIIA